MKRPIITLPSMTFAQKARTVLAASGITALPVRLTAEESAEGCAWGVAVEDGQLETALHVLNTSDLPFRRIINK